MMRKCLLLIFALSALTGTAESTFSPQNRPKELQDLINTTAALVGKEEASWHFNGQTSYEPLELHDTEILFHMIMERLKTPGQQKIYIVEVGAGNGTWARHQLTELTKRLVALGVKSKDVRVYFYSFTGDRYKYVSPLKTSHGEAFFFSSFAIENLKSELEKRHLSFLQDKVDFLISEMTFVHLHDAWGTLFQCYDLLRPKGLMFVDGVPTFFASQKPEGNPQHFWTMSEVALFHSIGASFLLINKSGASNVGKPFVLMRNTQEHLALPMRYERLEERSIASHTPSKIVPLFAWDPPQQMPCLSSMKPGSLFQNSGDNPEEEAWGDAKLFKLLSSWDPSWKKHLLPIHFDRLNPCPPPAGPAQP